MKISEAIDQLNVGDKVWVKGEVAYINKSGVLPLALEFAETTKYFVGADEISLTEPKDEKVEVPDYIAKLIRKYKAKKETLVCSIANLYRESDEYKWYVDNAEIYERAWVNGYTVKPKRWVVKEGDLVIRKGKHEAKVYFVEGADEDGILLVNGIQDEYYSDEDCNLDNFYEEFRLLAKKENLESEVDGSVEEITNEI